MIRVMKVTGGLILCTALLFAGMALQEPLSAAGISFNQYFDRYATHGASFLVGGTIGCVTGWVARSIYAQTA